MGLKKIKLGEVLSLSDLRNENGLLNEESVRGISTSKVFIPTKADLNGVNLLSYKVVRPGMFAYVADTSRRGDKISLAYNNSEDSYLVSSISTVFYVTKDSELYSEYLFMFFNRPEFDRYSRFHSWGSARETFDWETMCDIDLFLPDYSIQKRFADVYKSMALNRGTKDRIAEICPILIRGSLIEGAK